MASRMTSCVDLLSYRSCLCCCFLREVHRDWFIFLVEGNRLDLNVCFSCGNNDDLRCSSEEGENRVIQAARERRRLNDETSTAIIGKILDKVPDNDQILQFKYHHICYSKFTDQGKLNYRLRKKT